MTAPAPVIRRRSPWAEELIADHWFRAGPPSWDGADGYWICGLCSGHRGRHVQAEGDWRKALHAFVPQRHAPSHCKPCGRRRRHTTHAPLWWDELTRGG
ncbi:hypothetical protein [Streptomyces sp. NPDC020983]|uniref:hypothetical protein n=1 Tax=Streptomyces sp. NPDC020983 TaxID=3365106 RepID=UPI0037A823C9